MQLTIVLLSLGSAGLKEASLELEVCGICACTTHDNEAASAMEKATTPSAQLKWILSGSPGDQKGNFISEATIVADMWSTTLPRTSLILPRHEGYGHK